MRVYLAGPIFGCNDSEAKDWRQWIKDNAWDGLEVFDPMVRDYRGVEDANVREIVELDKQDIDGVQALIVNFPKPSAGTCMEILYAWERGKTIITVVPRQDKISPWVRYHSHHIVYSFADALWTLKEAR